MAFRFRSLSVGNPSLSYKVTDQKALTGGISVLEYVLVGPGQWFAFRVAEV
jgi:hypothetical protein